MRKIIYFRNERFNIKFDFDRLLKERLKASVIGRAFDPKESVWVAPLSSAESIERFAKENGFEIAESAREAIEMNKAFIARSAKKETNFYPTRLKHPEINGKPAELYPYQRAGVEYAIHRKRVIIADEMGLGKTVQAIATVLELQSLPVLIVCPNSLKQNWKRELEMWGDLRVQVLSAGDAARSNVDAWVINYDILSRYETFFQRLAVAVVFDESHRLKSTKTKRFEAAKVIVEKKEVVLLLTGTPIQNRPYELVAQLQLIERLKDFGGWFNFVKRYCGGGRGYGGSLQTDGASNIKELNDKLRATCMVRREKRDVLTELPKMTRTKVVVEARGDLYNRVLNQVLLLDKLGMVEIDALRQSSALEKIPFVIDFVRDVIEEGESIVLFAHHKEVIKQLRESIEAEFKIAPSVITGDVAGEKRQQAVDAFQSGKTPIILCSMMAAGEGITLTRSSKVGFLEIGWHYAQHAQCEARVDRIGQTFPTTAYYFLSKDTTDETDFSHFILKKGDISSVVASGRSLSEFFNLTN